MIRDADKKYPALNPITARTLLGRELLSEAAYSKLISRSGYTLLDAYMFAAINGIKSDAWRAVVGRGYAYPKDVAEYLASLVNEEVEDTDTDTSGLSANREIPDLLANPITIVGNADQFIPLSAATDVLLPVSSLKGQKITIVTKLGLSTCTLDKQSPQTLHDTAQGVVSGPITLAAASEYRCFYIGSNIWDIYHNTVTSP